MKIAKLLIPCLLGLALATPAKADNGLALAYMFGYGGGFYNMGVPTYNNMQMPYFSSAPSGVLRAAIHASLWGEPLCRMATIAGQRSLHTSPPRRARTNHH